LRRVQDRKIAGGGPPLVVGEAADGCASQQNDLDDNLDLGTGDPVSVADRGQFMKLVNSNPTDGTAVAVNVPLHGSVPECEDVTPFVEVRAASRQCPAAWYAGNITQQHGLSPRPLYKNQAMSTFDGASGYAIFLWRYETTDGSWVLGRDALHHRWIFIQRRWFPSGSLPSAKIVSPTSK
jgi:hypothetical protein